MGGNPITKQVAEQALKKLEAVDVSQKGDAHPTFAVYYRKRIIAITGLRHSSKKDILVPHVKSDLRVNTAFVLELARCTKYRNHWLHQLGEITEEEMRDSEWIDDSRP